MERKENASKRMGTYIGIISPALGREGIKLPAYTRIGRGGVNVILCDLCGNQKECFQKEIDGREFDICTDCWRPLEEKLRGKGRSKGSGRWCSCLHRSRQTRRSQ